MNRRTALVVDADERLRRGIRVQLEDAGYETFAASDGTLALEIMAEKTPTLVLADLKMPGISGMDLLRRLRSQYPDTTVIMMTAFGTVQNAVAAMRAGAFDYITKPIDCEELLLILDRAQERSSLMQEVQSLRATLGEKCGFETIVGHAKPLLRVLNMAARVAPTDAVVLLCGETGTGKELLARAIHHNSRRKERPFVVIDCGAIPKDLLESELFGHVRGAFTGAIAHRQGRVETANGGTLLLDEIGELPFALQVKLLRLIQHGDVEKVGAAEWSRVDVRIIAATNRNLKAMVEDGAFREDLYYRLAVIPLELPPLRERAEDIPELAQHLFLNARRKHGRPNLGLPASLLPHFSSYYWPGNVRELENVIERLVVLTAGNEITLEDLPDSLRRDEAAVDRLRLDLPAEGLSLEGVEKELIVRALKKCSWNQTRAAKYLDISRRTLIYRMEKYGIRREPDGLLPDSAQGLRTVP